MRLHAGGMVASCAVTWDAVPDIEAAVNPRLMFEGCLIVFSLLLSLGLIT